MDFLELLNVDKEISIDDTWKFIEETLESNR